MNFVTRKNGKRVIGVFTVFLAISILIIARLGYIQIIKDKKISNAALGKLERAKIIYPVRGDILDRNHMKLAINTYSYDVWIKAPEKEETGRIDATAKELSVILNRDEEEIKKLLSESKRNVKIASGLNKEAADKIANVNYTSVWTDRKLKRIYPYDNFAAYVIGHMQELDGVYGVEASYNDVLKGVEGKIIRTTDATGRQLPIGKSEEIPVQNGNNVVLTIDQAIQHYAEKALEKVVTNQNPKRAMAIVLNPNTGEILAMAVKKDYNPNRPLDLTGYYNPSDIKNIDSQKEAELRMKMWINPIVSEIYEPGSTFKLLTVAAALTEGVVTPNSVFVDNGYVNVGGTVIRNWDLRANGSMTVTKAIEQSTNTVLVQIGRRMKTADFYKRLKTFGVMDKTGIDLSAEANSGYQPLDSVGAVGAATMTYGHGISITPLQDIVSISALVNDGKLMKPYIVKAVEDQNGKVIKRTKPVLVRKVVSKKVSKDIKMMMEAVVMKGSGRMAQIPGVRIGGKTGTSTKVINGVYSNSKVVSSFVGVASVDDPNVTVLVIVDEPAGSTMSSVVSVPVAKEILQKIINYNKTGIGNKDSVTIRMPSLKGFSHEKAVFMLEALGLKVRIMPREYDRDLKRTVKSQHPKAGTLTKKGSTATITLK